MLEYSIFQALKKTCGDFRFWHSWRSSKDLINNTIVNCPLFRLRCWQCQAEISEIPTQTPLFILNSHTAGDHISDSNCRKTGPNSFPSANELDRHRCEIISFTDIGRAYPECARLTDQSSRASRHQLAQAQGPQGISHSAGLQALRSGRTSTKF